jgi:hypothetical protein
MTTEAHLLFAGRKGKDGSFEVRDQAGKRLGATTRRRTLLTAEDHLGRVLFTAERGRGRRWWTATGSDGETLVQLRQPKFHPWPQALLREGTLSAAYDGPRSLSTKWKLAGSDGEVLLTSEPSSTGLFNKPWLVSSSGLLSLAEVVAVVEMHRLNVVTQRAASSTGSV